MILINTSSSFYEYLDYWGIKVKVRVEEIHKFIDVTEVPGVTHAYESYGTVNASVWETVDGARLYKVNPIDYVGQSLWVAITDEDEKKLGDKIWCQPRALRRYTYNGLPYLFGNPL